MHIGYSLYINKNKFKKDHFPFQSKHCGSIFFQNIYGNIKCISWPCRLYTPFWNFKAFFFLCTFSFAAIHYFFFFFFIFLLVHLINCYAPPPTLHPPKTRFWPQSLEFASLRYMIVQVTPEISHSLANNNNKSMTLDFGWLSLESDGLNFDKIESNKLDLILDRW